MTWFAIDRRTVLLGTAAAGIVGLPQAAYARTKFVTANNNPYDILDPHQVFDIGRIVNMSSINALSGGVTSAVSKHSYAAAKAGILGLTRSLAKEFGAKILINAICPGVIKTELGNSLTRSREPELIKGIAVGRLGTPQDVAQLVNVLATSEPCYLTGQHFVIDGFQWSC